MKIGITGAGGMARYHYEGFTRAGAEVVALADVNEQGARAFAGSRGIKKVYPSLEAMLKSEALDGVSIITPNKFHKPLIIQALQAGKHVFCENRRRSMPPRCVRFAPHRKKPVPPCSLTLTTAPAPKRRL